MIKRAFSKIVKRLSSLRFRFLVVFFFAALIGIGVYVSTHAISIAYIDTVYTSEENKDKREQNYLEDLQQFIDDNEISIENTSKISEWVRANRYVYLLLSKEGEIFFTSDDATNDGDESDGTDGDTDDDTDGDGKGDESGNGVTVKYPSREELLNKANENEHIIDLKDGVATASFVEFTEYLYYDVVNIATLVIAFSIMLFIIMLYIKRVTGRILDLGESVNTVAAGNTGSVISVSGKDEIATLAANVENMRSSMVENYEKEKAALADLLALKKEYSYTVLVFVTTVEGLEMGTQKRPGKLVTKYGKDLCIVDFALSTENALLAWLKKHFDAEGIAVTAQPLRELLLLVGNSMDLLSHEVKKLSAYLHQNGRSELTAEDVQAVTAATVRSDAFALSNAVYEGNRTLALEAIREMKAERVDSMVALGMLVRIYHELLPVAILTEDGKDTKDIEAALKINPFRLKHMTKAVRTMGLARLGESIAALSEMDVASKNGGVSGYSAIEMFLMQYL